MIHPSSDRSLGAPSRLGARRHGGPACAESRAPIGWVIVGGLSFGTLLTLFVIPTAYTLLARRGRATGAEAYEPSPAPEPAALADRFHSPQSPPEWAQRR